MDDISIALTSGFISSGPERIYYETAGQGDAVVLCHGLGGNHAVWFQQVPVMARSYRVVVWDQRGFGRSSNQSGDVSPAAAVNDLKALMDHLGIHQAHFVGQSMGGWTIVGFALAYPERVRSLVIADSLGGIYTPEIERGFDTFLQMAANGPDTEELLLGQHPAIGKALTQHDIARAYLYQEIGSFGEPPPVRTVFRLLRATAYPHAALKALALPVLFIVGSKDQLISPDWVHRAAALLPTARVVEIPGTGHSPYFEEPRIWNEIVLEFLSKVELSGSP